MRGIHEQMKGNPEIITDTTMKMRNLRLKRLNYLPYEIIFDILSRLPVNVLLEFKIVCKTWYSMIKDPHFIELHFRQSSRKGRLPHALLHRECENMQTIFSIVDEGEGQCRRKAKKEDLFDKIGVARNFSISGSCNGLVCIFPHMENHVDPIFICNLATRECSKLPATEELVIFQNLLTGKRDIFSKSDPSLRFLQPEIAFGYEDRSKSYKLVRMFSLYYDEVISMAGEIMTVGERRWRRLEFPQELNMSRISQTLCIKGSFYWIINDMFGVSSPDKILVLDFCSEKFSTIKFPPLMAVDRSVETPRLLLKLGDSLGMGECEVQKYKMHIWKMIQGNWMFQHTVMNMQVGTRHIDDDIFFNTYHNGHKAHLLLLDARQGHATELEVSGCPPTFDTICFVPSLVSPRLLINVIVPAQSRKRYHDRAAMSLLLS